LEFKRWFLIICLISLFGESSAFNSNKTTIGFRTGTSENEMRGSFNQYEIFIARALPLDIIISSKVALRPRMEVSIASLVGESKTGYYSTVGTITTVDFANNPISIEVGSSFTFLNKYEYEQVNIGGLFHFISHIGISLKLYQHIRTTFRFQHMSNAGIRQPNPGINLNIWEINYSF